MYDEYLCLFMYFFFSDGAIESSYQWEKILGQQLQTFTRRWIEKDISQEFGFTPRWENVSRRLQLCHHWLVLEIKGIDPSSNERSQISYHLLQYFYPLVNMSHAYLFFLKTLHIIDNNKKTSDQERFVFHWEIIFLLDLNRSALPLSVIHTMT